MADKTTPPLQFEPSFIEEAVFLTVKSKEEAGDHELSRSFHNQKNQIYDVTPTDKRNKAFAQFTQQLFSEFELLKFFETQLNQFPLIGAVQPLILIKRVWSTKQEGVELYIEGSHHTVVISLQVARVLDLLYLESFLQFELMHISDMLDPNFQYSTTPDLGGVGDVENDLVRERFRLLWNLSISARLQKRGSPTLIPIDKLTQDITISFSHWTSGSRENLLRDLFGSKSWTQQDFINLAKDDRLNKVLGEGGLRCPLCHFSSYESKNQWEKIERPVLDEIKIDHPNWKPENGACSQCIEMYTSNLRLSV